MSSFLTNSSLLCHRCRTVSGTSGADSLNHLCDVNRDLYTIRVYTINDLFQFHTRIVGGFSLPVSFVENRYTNMPCPIEYIVTDTNTYLKIGQGCTNSGPFYVFLLNTGRIIINFYKLDGSRILSRDAGNVSSLAVYFNKVNNSSVVPSGSNPSGFVQTTTPTD